MFLEVIFFFSKWFWQICWIMTDVYAELADNDIYIVELQAINAVV